MKLSKKKSDPALILSMMRFHGFQLVTIQAQATCARPSRRRSFQDHLARGWDGKPKRQVRMVHVVSWARSYRHHTHFIQTYMNGTWMVIEVLCTGLVVDQPMFWISLQKLRRSSEAGITWIMDMPVKGLLLWYLAFVKLPGRSRSQFLCSVLTLHPESILAIMSTDVFLNRCERVRHRKEKGTTILKTWWLQSWNPTICWVFGFHIGWVDSMGYWACRCNSENALRNTVPKPNPMSVRLPVALWPGLWYNLQNVEQVLATFGSWIFIFWFFLVNSQRWIGLAWYFEKWMTVVILSRHAKAQSAKDLRDAARRKSASKQKHGSHEHIRLYDTMIYYVNQIRSIHHTILILL